VVLAVGTVRLALKLGAGNIRTLRMDDILVVVLDMARGLIQVHIEPRYFLLSSIAAFLSPLNNVDYAIGFDMKWWYGFACIVLLACSEREKTPLENVEAGSEPIGQADGVLESAMPADSASSNDLEGISVPRAAVVAVAASGSPGAYTLSVTVSSPDTGCDQYADWWEVLDEEGQLLYRRVLLHSHVGEQPFARSGGPVPIIAEQVVWVRAHMSVGGYGGTAFKGSVAGGFSAVELAADFAVELAEVEPLPQGCAF